MSKEIVGAVARVLSDRDVVLNRGKDHGIKVGDYVGIIDEEASTVKNPETGEDIGEIVSFKVSLRVTQVSQSLAIASTYRVRQVNRGGFGTGLGIASASARLLEEPNWVEEVEHMKVSAEVDASLGGTRAPVSVGDAFKVVPKVTADAGFTI